MRVVGGVCLALLFACASGTAQFAASQPNSAVELMVVVAGDGSLVNGAVVQLRDRADVPLGRRMIDGSGKATFTVPPGDYQIVVTATDHSESTVRVSLLAGRSYHQERLELQRTTTPSGMPISAKTLAIPSSAAHEFERGSKALASGNRDEARKRFQLALNRYPSYAAAHNNLGVLLIQGGDRSGARAAFESAIAADPDFAKAYINLARMAQEDGQTTELEQLLTRFLAIDPKHVEGLFLMGRMEATQGKYDSALRHLGRIHDLPHAGFEQVHLLEARILERLQQPERAAAEYRLFLQESPRDAKAPEVRRTLEQLSARR